jgi:hypothetical protein
MHLGDGTQLAVCHVFVGAGRFAKLGVRLGWNGFDLTRPICRQAAVGLLDPEFLDFNLAKFVQAAQELFGQFRAIGQIEFSGEG